MTVQVIKLSKERENKVSSISATFVHEGNIIPFKVNEVDRPEVYKEVEELISSTKTSSDSFAEELFNLMSPAAKIEKTIKSSFYLSKNVSIRNGGIYFEGKRIEETLEAHLFSLLDDETPKDEKLWSSYVRFLDNLYQNANEEIREQLFRWMDYENKKGQGFAITEDGFIVGYKGCDGTILEPVSKHSGFAIVDGIEMNGHIPNKVGSVISMPRSAVQHDPTVGCSHGLHVGTRAYATSWAPILLLVKVNPRDVVSVPFECESQKMRVCEYTILEVTDASKEHKNFYSYGSESSNDELSELRANLGKEVVVIEDGETYEGTLTDAFMNGDDIVAIVRDGFDDVLLEFIVSDDKDCSISLAPENYVLSLDGARELMDAEEEIEIQYDGKTFVGIITDVYDKPGKEPGIIVNDFHDTIKHIKLHRIENFFSLENGEIHEEDLDDFEDLEVDNDALDSISDEVEEFKDLLNENVTVKYDGDRTFSGVVSSVYDEPGKEPGVIIRGEFQTKHIKIQRIDMITIECDCDESNPCEGCEDGCIVEASQFSEILKYDLGTKLLVVFKAFDGKFETVVGTLNDVNKCEQHFTVGSYEIQFEDVVVIQNIK